MVVCARCCERGFNPRPREGATVPSSFRPWAPSSFNPRPREGATDVCGASLLDEMFQSTPPRGGDHRDDACIREMETVSIHAPARGRRRAHRCPLQWRRVSIHAPARGRLPDWLRLSPPPMFQSTPPRGGDDRDRRQVRISGVFQSTPPRGGDSRCSWPARVRQGFNPRPREGATAYS